MCSYDHHKNEQLLERSSLTVHKVSYNKDFWPTVQNLFSSFHPLCNALFLGYKANKIIFYTYDINSKYYCKR